MSCESSTVIRDVVMEILNPDDRVDRVPVQLRYDTGDPYAACAEFHMASGRRVRWYFSRELMSGGLSEATGHGDVRIWPVSRRGEELVNIALASDDGHAVVQAAKADLVDFLGHSYALCPPGTESAYLDLDAELRSLFDREGA